MNNARTKAQLRDSLNSVSSIGFVPTMGALHDGHLSLIAESKRRNLFTVASIFVNPTQFNDPKDYEKYPIDTEADLAKLKAAGCDLVFLPSRDEMYGTQDEHRFLHDFGSLEVKFEGAFRPGHFKGVGQIVHKLFDAVQPNVAFFGEKDFQQLQVIRSLVEKAEMNIEIVGMPTVREQDGLAMSSRNRRLSDTERKESTTLYRALSMAKEALGSKTLGGIRAQVEEMIGATSTLRLEYFEIIDPTLFEALESYENGMSAHAIIAAYAGEVRLIDNLKLA